MLSDIVSLGVWDGLLEGRIRLHRVLVLSNRLPQHDTVKLYHQLGRQPLKTALRQSECFTVNTIQSFYSLCFPRPFSMVVWHSHTLALNGGSGDTSILNHF